MKKLAASLLFLPFIAGATVGAAVPRNYAPRSDYAATGDYAAATTNDYARTAEYAPPGSADHAALASSACAPRARGSISSGAAPATQPSLPGHLSAGIFTAPTALLETGSADTWRTPTRSGRSASDHLHAGSRTAEARTHLHQLQHGMLEFQRMLARARTNEPATFGNPPPASQT